MRSIRPVAWPITAALLAALHSHCLGAEIRVEGSVGDVRVEAHDATVAEIFAALGERFALRYRGTTGSRGVTATFEGPLRRVVARVLEGYNYVIQSRGDGLEVIVLSAESTRAVVPPTIAPPTYPAKNVRRTD
jgi:hypothetical protein